MENNAVLQIMPQAAVHKCSISCKHSTH